jgi:hypothetical protein
LGTLSGSREEAIATGTGVELGLAVVDLDGHLDAAVVGDSASVGALGLGSHLTALGVLGLIIEGG